MSSFFLTSYISTIASKIDKDHDEFITESELVEWLKNVTKTNINRDVDKKWEEFKNVNTLDAYLKHYYGALDFCKLSTCHDGQKKTSNNSSLMILVLDCPFLF